MGRRRESMTIAEAKAVSGHGVASIVCRDCPSYIAKTAVCKTWAKQVIAGNMACAYGKKLIKAAGREKVSAVIGDMLGQVRSWMESSEPVGKSVACSALREFAERLQTIENRKRKK